VIGLASLFLAAEARAQDAPSGPPPHDDLETDADGDGVPDGWYNLRDTRWVEGGVGRGHCFRMENDKPGRPARVSRGFTLDGREVDAIEIGLWVRLEGVRVGERLGAEPALIIDFLGDELKRVGWGSMGPWSQRVVGSNWVHVAKRIDVPPGTHDAIMTVGLLGATGTLELDELTITPVPVGGRPTTNLVRNGDVELGDPTPTSWVLEGSTHRLCPGFNRSAACINLVKTGARASLPIAAPLERVEAIDLAFAVKASVLRANGGTLTAYFVDDQGQPLTEFRNGARLFRCGGTFDWRTERVRVAVPRNAAGVVLQFDKPDAAGSMRIDDVRAVTSPDQTAGRWLPDHVATDTKEWKAFVPGETISPGSALDFSFLLPPPLKASARVVVRGNHLAEEEGGRVRLFGVSLLPPMGWPDFAKADALALQLARSGVGLVRIGDVDVPLGPGRSLIDDSRDDTRGLDAEALARFEHLVAALKERGIRIALELQTLRRFREGDGLKEWADLGPGGGPAAAFDPDIRARALEFAGELLGHVNPETKLPLREDAVLAWVTLAGEISLFDLSDETIILSTHYADALKAAVKAEKFGGKRAWESIEAAQWEAEHQALHKMGVKAPVAGSSHWRREPEFSAAQGELDLVDDRLFWRPPTWGSPEKRSLLWDRGTLVADANRKRKTNKPYVIGQFAEHTRGAWTLPFEGADFLLSAVKAREEDWDAFVRRGILFHPSSWGAAPAGTTGGDDVVQLPEVLNANPAVFCLLPHVASLLSHPPITAARPSTTPRAGASPPPVRREISEGRLAIDTPQTQGIAGWVGRQGATLSGVRMEVRSDYAVIVASSVGPEPIKSAKRLLVTAMGRCEPTGLRWADTRRDEVADAGRGPILFEPVQGRFLWKTSAKVRAFALDNTGERQSEVTLEQGQDGPALILDGGSAAVHWELVKEE
jgi:hypothetical protein